MSANPILRVVGGTEPNSKALLAEARRVARPVLNQWLRDVERGVVSGVLAPLDYLTAKALVNFPSANDGYCYVGRRRLAKSVGTCTRTAASSLRRLRAAGFLTRKRGGPGRTAKSIFCVHGVPIFDVQRAAPDVQGSARLDVQDSAHKPSELKPIKHKPPPKPPQRVLDEGGLGEEVTASKSEPSFDEFWRAIRHDPGQPGPAMAAWHRLSRNDRRAIDNLIGPHGIDLDGMWAAVWLAQRRWESAPLTRRRQTDAAEIRVIELKPGSPEWTAERDRKLAAGESVALIDSQASQGRGWSVRVHPLRFADAFNSVDSRSGGFGRLARALRQQLQEDDT